MNLPRWTAEAAAYGTREAYRTRLAAERDSGACVAPATAGAHSHA